MSLEIEKKFLDPDFDAVKSRLVALGARSEGLHFEHNEVFDTTGHELFQKGSLLRLRVREWPDHKNAALTFKSAPAAALYESDCKIREELELGVENATVMAEILVRLGYMKVAIYEKYRETWRLPDSEKSLKIDMDILPFRRVVEIEGSPAEMDKMSALLGLDGLKTSVQSYHALHRQWLESHNLPFEASFTFSGDTRPDFLPENFPPRS